MHVKDPGMFITLPSKYLQETPCNVSRGQESDSFHEEHVQRYTGLANGPHVTTQTLCICCTHQDVVVLTVPKMSSLNP